MPACKLFADLQGVWVVGSEYPQFIGEQVLERSCCTCRVAGFATPEGEVVASLEDTWMVRPKDTQVISE
jgi:hypothetical protein